MKVWIVWLPNIGKSTLFNALTNNYSADVGNFPFCTIEPNVGIVDVKDNRLYKLSKMSNTKKIIPATIEFVDIAGLVRGASKWEWLGNQFLATIREVDAIVQVLRDFEDKDVWHVEWNIDPIRDVEIINTELIISDLEKVEKLMDSMKKKYEFKTDKDAVIIYPMLEIAKWILEKEELLYNHREEFNKEAKIAFKQYGFLTFKPFIYAINIWEEDICEAEKVIEKYSKIGTVIPVSAKLEFELIELEEEDKKDYLSEFDCDVIAKVWLDNLIKKAFNELWLMYYFTTGEKETRAWQIKRGYTAPQAAGVIHTDFERWFIKAEIVSYEHLIEGGSWNKAKENWKLRLEGKAYTMQDGDVVLFRFNV